MESKEWKKKNISKLVFFNSNRLPFSIEKPKFANKLQYTKAFLLTSL